MANFSNILSSQTWFGDKIRQETIVKFIQDHFTVSWEYFFRFQIPYLVRHRTFFGDLESWNVWGSIALVQIRELIEKNIFKFCWIVDYPMFEKDEITNKIKFSHNPFSMPQGNLSKKDFENPLDILAYQYDIVCNGIELSSGAIRNHKPELMYKLFSIAGYDKKQ